MKKLLFLMLALVAITTSCEKNGGIEVELIEVQVLDDVDLLNCPYYKDAFRINIKTDGAWELAFSEDWIFSMDAKGVGTSSTYIMLAENTTASSREATFKVINAVGESSETFTVKQGTVEEMDDNSEEVFVNCEKVGDTWEIYSFYGLLFFSMEKQTDGEILKGKLMNDIDIQGWGFDPLFEDGFRGHFYGNNYTIKNLIMERDKDCVGLFAQLRGGAVVSDLHIENFEVTGPKDSYYSAVGALAGLASGLEEEGENEIIRISNCSVLSGKITGSDMTGGLVGRAQCVQFTYCANYADITSSAGIGHGYTGGIVGRTLATSVVACYNVGDIHATGEANINAGGIVGYADGSSVYTYVRACYGIGNITAVGSSVDIGAIAGDECSDISGAGNDLIALDCYYDNALSAFGDSDDIEEDEWRRAYKKAGSMNTPQTVGELNSVLNNMANTTSEYDYTDVHGWLMNEMQHNNGALKLFKVGADGYPVFDENIR